MKKKLCVLLACSMLLTLLAACGESGAGSSAPPAGSSTQPTQSGGVDTPNSEKKEGGRLTISAATPTTRAWYDIRGIMAIAMFGYIYEPLARYGSDGSPEPFLAQSITPDADALTWTIVLRDGIQFSDGSPCDAEAVAGTWTTTRRTAC